MKWYYKVKGSHTHIKVYMNGALCGQLCFLHYEFREITEHCPWIAFIPES